MNWEKYVTHHKGLGTLCEVYIDYKQGFIKRIFNKESKTVNGKVTRFTEQEVDNFFKNEIFWLQRLESRWLPELIDVEEKEQYIVQKYYNPNLLDFKHKLYEIMPDIEFQVIEMYKFFKEKNVYKRNGSLSNLTFHKNQLIAFDFKWATERPDGLEKEVFSYENWLSKINRKLIPQLKELL